MNLSTYIGVILNMNINFLEHFWDKIKSNQINNYPYPISLHIGLAYTVQLEDRKTNLLWLPYENTGIAYVEGVGTVNIHPYYRGKIVKEFDISHGTDLYKPKTEEAALKYVRTHSEELHQIIATDTYYNGSAADYLHKFQHICSFLHYFNSEKIIKHSLRHAAN
jgi:hypothetical protein